MASKQVIETNKLKIGSSGMTGLYVGNAESKYAVLSDANKAQTVIYDKVTYNFSINDLTTVVPASGGTYNITAAASTRTHGNGTVDNVSFSPTSITIPANQGDIYSSAITVTQASSNLTDQFNFTVTGEVVTQITLTLGNPSVIPASGGSVSNASTSATVYYSSGRQTTACTPTQVKFNTVSANSKGTTVSDQTTAGTLTCYIVFDGVTSNTATKTVYQQANAVTGSGCTPVTITAPASGSLGQIAASGGTKTPTKTATGGVAWTSYTSTSSATSQSNITWAAVMTSGNGFTINATTGAITAASKGTTLSNATTSNTATIYAYTSANGVGRTANTTYYATQQENYVIQVTARGTGTNNSHFQYSNVEAKATSAPVTLKGAATYKYTSTKTSTSAPASGTSTYSRTYSLASSQNGFTAVNTAGTLTCTARGTEIGNARTSAAVTGVLTVTYVHPSGINGGTVTSQQYSTTATCTQNGNYVTAITVASQAISYDTIPAGGGSKTPTGSNGTVTYKFSSTSTSTTEPGADYGALSSSVTYSMSASGRFTLKSTSTGEVSATSKGTSIENVTSSDTITKTVNYTWTPTTTYNAAGTKTVSGTTTTKAKQAGNYVSSLTVTTNPAISYGSAIPAGGGSITPTGGVGAVSYNFTSGDNSATAPGSAYGALTTPTTYSMATGGDSRITPKSSSTGELTGTTKGTTVVGVTSSGTVTKTVTYTWTPTSSYNGGGTITKTGSATAKGTQAANAVVSYTDYQNPTGLSITGSQVPASGSTTGSTITWSGTAAQNAKAVYTSNATASTYTNVAPSVSTAVTGNSAVASKGTTISNATTALTVTGYYWANDKTASTSCYVTQPANHVTSISVSGQAVAIENIPAGGGSKTPTGGNGTVTYTFTSTSTSTTKPGTSYGALTSSVTYSMTATGRFTLKSTSTGEVSATSKGTNIENVTNANTLTKTVNYTWTPTSGYNGTGTKTCSGSTTCTPKQDGNYVSSLVFTTNSTLTFASAIPASGGSITDSGGNGAVKVNYTSGSSGTTFPGTTYGTSSVTKSYSMTSGNGFTATSTTNGTISAATKGTTVSNITSSNTVTKTVTYTWTPTTNYNAGGTKSVSNNSATGKATQAANSHTDSWNNPVVTFSYPSGSIVAGGGTKTPTVSATQSGTATFTSTATASTANTSFTYAYSMTAAGGFSVNATSGVVTATSKGTTISNVTTSNTVTVTCTGAGSKTGTATANTTQAGNYVVSATATTSSTGTHVSYANIAAGATYADPTKNGAVILTFSSTSTEKRTNNPTGASIAWNRTYTLASSQNGFTAVNSSSGRLTATSLGTTISNARTSANVTSVLTPVITHTSTYGGTVVTATSMSCTVTCTQNGNYVTSISVASQAVAIDNIPAGGGSKTPTGSNGTVTYTFTSTSTSTTKPGTTYGALTSSVTYSMTATGRFTLKSTSTGEVSATTKGTTIENVTNANTLTKTVSYTWTPTSSYNAAGTKTCSGTATCTPKQDGNYVSSISVASQAISYSAIPAAGGSVTPTGSNGTVTYTFTSTSTSTTAPGTTYGALTSSVSYAMTNSGRFTLKSTSTGEVSATSKGTSVESVTSSNTVTKTVSYTWTPTASYNAAGTKTCSGTATVKATQAANAVTSTTWSNPSISAFSYAAISAGGGSKTPTVTASQSGTNYYTSGSSASTSNSSFTKAFSMTASGRFTLKSTSTGEVSATSKGTSVESVTSSNTITVTVTGSGSKTASTTTKATQAANAVTSTTWNNPSISAFSYAAIPAGGGSKTPTVTVSQSGTKYYTSGSNEATSNSSFTKLFSMTNSGRFTLKSTSTGEVSATSKGTSIENVTSSDTITVYAYANSKTASTTTKATQSGNYVTEITVTATCTFSGTIPASGGSISDTGGDAGVSSYKFTSGSNTATKPGTTYGSLSATTTWSMTAGNGFSLSNYTVTAEGRGTTTGSSRNSNTITETAKCWWTHSSTYSAGGTVSGQTTDTDYCVQEANAKETQFGVVNVTSPKNSIGQIGAGGGSQTPTLSAWQACWSGYTSGSGSNSWTNTTFTWTFNKSANAGLGSGFYFKNTSTGQLSATSRGTTTGAERTSSAVTAYAAANGATGSSSYYCTQAANSLSTSYGNVTITSPSGSIGQMAASDDYITPTLSAWQACSSGYTSGDGSGSWTNTTFTWAFNKSAGASLGTGFYFKNATTGQLSATSRGTTTGSVRTSSTVTVYAYANSKTGNTTYYATQQANEKTVTWGNISCSGVQSGNNCYTFPASGGVVTIDSIMPATQSWTSGYTSGSGSGSGSISVSPSSCSLSALHGIGLVNSSSTYYLTAATRGTTTGSSWGSNTITINWSSNGKTLTRSPYATQEANAVESLSGTTSPYPQVYMKYGESNVLYNMPATGGTITPTLTYKGAVRPVFTSGAYGTTTNVTASMPKTFSYYSGTNYLTLNSSNGNATASANTNEGTRSETIKVELTWCGLTVCSYTDTLGQDWCKIYVQLSGNTNWRFYGTILCTGTSWTMSNGGVSSDKYGGSSWYAPWPSGGTSICGISGSWQGSSPTISSPPYLTVVQNSTYYRVQNMLPQNSGSTQCAFITGFTSTFTAYPGDTITVYFNRP